MNQVTASIPDSTRSYVTSMFSRDQLRGITVYFGIGEERPFYVEKTPSLLMERVRHNFSFFYLNYLLSTCVFFLLSLITNLSALIGMMLIACVWLWFIKASSSGSLVVGCKLVAEPSLFSRPLSLSLEQPFPSRKRLLASVSRFSASLRSFIFFRMYFGMHSFGQVWLPELMLC